MNLLEGTGAFGMEDFAPYAQMPNPRSVRRGVRVPKPTNK